MAIIKVNLGRIVPTPGGIVDQRFIDGDDAGANPPTTPTLGQPSVIDDDSADFPLLLAATGGTAPLVYELELSIVDAVSGFAVHDADADFSGDAVYRATGLAPSTVYFARLSAVDDDDRRSGYSGVVTFTTPAVIGGDVTAPTAPTSVSATSTTAGEGDFTWTNGTDAVGIVSTKVIRGNGDGAGNPSGTGTTIAILDYPATTYHDPSAPEGQQVFYRAEHLDAAGNASAKSAHIYVTIATSSGGTIRWNPGNYISTPDATTDQDVQDAIDYVIDKSHLKGVVIRQRWTAIESSLGNYSFTELTNWYNQIAAAGKKMWLQFETKDDGAAPSAIVPSYMLNATYGGGAFASGNTTSVVWWNANVMDRFIALIQASANWASTRSSVEGIAGAETSLGGFTTGVGGYTSAGIIAQYLRLFPAMRTAGPELNFLTMFSHLPNASQAQRNQLIAGMYASKIALGGPDSLYTKDTGDTSSLYSQGRRCAMGLEGPTDYRGILPMMVGDQYPGLTNTTYVALNLLNWAKGTGGASHGGAWSNWNWWFYKPNTRNFPTIMSALIADPTRGFLSTKPAGYP